MSVENIRRCQAAIRREAQRFTVEEALNGLAAVAAEAILSVPMADQGKLVQVFTAMVLDYRDKTAASRPMSGSPVLIQ